MAIDDNFTNCFKEIITRCLTRNTVHVAGHKIELNRENGVYYIVLEYMKIILNSILTIDHNMDDIERAIRHIFTIHLICIESKAGIESKNCEAIKVGDITEFALIQTLQWFTKNKKDRDEDAILFQNINITSLFPQNERAEGDLEFPMRWDDEYGSILPFSAKVNVGDAAAPPDVNDIFTFREKEDREPYFVKPRGKKSPSKSDGCRDRPFICEFYSCRRAFRRAEHLKRHMKMHTGEKPFKCGYPGCMRAFSRSDNLKSHYQTHAGERGHIDMKKFNLERRNK